MKETKVTREAVIELVRKSRLESENSIKVVDFDIERELGLIAEHGMSDVTHHIPYAFPDLLTLAPILSKLRKVSTERLLDRLKNKKKHEVEVQYSTIRDNYCAVNLILNERGIIAPSFRSFRSFDFSRKDEPDQVMLGRDRQVIDIHYLYCHYRNEIVPLDDEFASLMESETFDENLASLLAEKEWKAEHKALKVLGMIEPQMYETAVLKSKVVDSRQRYINRLSKEMGRKLKELAADPSSRLKCDDINFRLEEYICLSLAKGSQVDAAKFWLLRGNEPDISAVNKSSLSARLGKRKKWFKEKFGKTIK